MSDISAPAMPPEQGRPLWLAIGRVLVGCAIAFAGLMVIFIALLAAALTLPDDAKIQANLKHASETGVLSGSSYPMSPFGRSTEHQTDMYTDCVAFGMNLNNSSAPLLTRMADDPTSSHEAVGWMPCEKLAHDLKTNEINSDFGYLRFWHGFQVYFRPLLSVVPLEAFRRITALLFFASMLFYAHQMVRQFGPWAWAVAVVPFFAFSDFFNVPMFATHAVSLTWAFFAAALVPTILQRIPKAREMALPVFVFSAGAIYNYLNMLFNPPLAPALMAFIYIAMNISLDARQTRQAVLYAFGLAALWFAGFFAAWLAKWVFAAIVLGPDAVIHELQNTVAKYGATQERMGVHILGPSRRNLINGWPFFFGIMASLGVALAGLGLLIRKRGKWLNHVLTFLTLITPLLVVVAWVEANPAHSSEHSGFVSRSFVFFAVFPLLAMIKLWREPRLVR